MNEPPIPTPWPEPEEPLPVMTCPYCGRKEDLNWGRYLRTFGKLKCLNCKQVSRIKRPLRFWAIIFPVGFLGGVPFAFGGFYFFNYFEAVLASWSIGYLLVGCMLDRHFYRRYGVLIKNKP